MKKTVLEVINEMTALKIGDTSVIDCCADLYTLADFLKGFAGYTTEHAGEEKCLKATGLICEAMTSFLLAENKFRTALMENEDKLFSSLSPLPGSPIDMLNIPMKEGKINPNKS